MPKCSQIDIMPILVISFNDLSYVCLPGVAEASPEGQRLALKSQASPLSNAYAPSRPQGASLRVSE